MIPYHGTPVSGSRVDIIRFLRGRHALVPFLRPDDVGAVAEACKSFVFDNSAFTAWKQGAVIDFDAYVAWSQLWARHPGFDWALIPDIIDGSEQDNDTLLRDWPSDVKGVPVWHYHESMKRLDWLVHSYDVVALGSSGEWPTPGARVWWERTKEVMKVACDKEGRPRCKLHGLRMLDPRIFTRMPLSSADSTNAAINSSAKDRYGMYVPPTQAQRAAVIAERIEVHNSAPLWREDNASDLQLQYDG